MNLGVKRRDIVLLIVLVLVLVAVFYYLYTYQGRNEQIQMKTTELEGLQSQVEMTKQTIAKEGLLDTRIKELESSIKSHSGKYYAEIKQENEIVNIGGLYETSAIEISSMSFDKSFSKLSELANEALSKIGVGNEEGEMPQQEEVAKQNPNFKDPISTDALQTTASAGDDSMDQLVVSLKTSMNYKGTFQDLEKFMSNIYGNQKYIVLDNISIQSDGEGMLSGNMSIVMHGLPKISELFGPDDHIYYEGVGRRASESEVYMPYETFVRAAEPTYDGGSSLYEPVVEVDPFGIKEGEVAKTLYGFEGMDYFFVPSSELVNGAVSRVSTRKQGLHGALMNYEFMEKGDDNIANLVFDKNPIIINEIADRVEMFVYTNSSFKNKLKLVLVDQFSQEHVLDMTLNYVDGEKSRNGAWAIASSPLPDSLTVPFAIERICVQGEGDVQDLSGSIIFDNLRMISMEKSNIVIPE